MRFCFSFDSYLASVAKDLILSVLQNVYLAIEMKCVTFNFETHKIAVPNRTFYFYLFLEAANSLAMGALSRF